MLVKTNRHVPRLSISARLRHDAGSTLVTVLIVMLVLTIGGLALSVLAMRTAGTVTNTRDRSAAQAEVDGVIAMKSVDLTTGRLVCDTANQQSGTAKNGTSTVPVNWTLDCTAAGTVGTATIQARAIVGGEQALRNAVYSYELAPSPPGYGDMTFYGNTVVTFTTEVHPGSASNPVTLVIPNAGFTCQGEIWGSVIAKGNITINGSGCKVHGDLVSVDGVITGNQDDAKIDGNITTGGIGTNTVYGIVGGNVHTRGPIDFSWSNRTVSGSVVSGGNVELRETRITGSLTMPASSTLNKSGGTYGSLVKLATVPAPQLPTLPAWFEFQYKPSEWPGFTNVITLDPALPNTNVKSCDFYNSYPHYTLAPRNGWTDLNSIPSNTVLDGRACNGLSTNFGMSPAVKLPHDLLILAKQINTTSSTWNAAPGLPSKPSVWFVTEDPNPSDHAPTCSGLGDMYLNHVGTTTAVKAMAYTPCKVNVAGNSTFNGQLYGAGFNYGGGLNFLPDDISLPGMSTGSEEGSPGNSGVVVGSFVLQSSQNLPIP